MIHSIPENSVMLGDHSGRRVVVRHPGSILSGDVGEVVFGPYQFDYSVRVKVERQRPGRDTKEEKRTSKPHYYVRLDKWGRCFTFFEDHLTFTDSQSA